MTHRTNILETLRRFQATKGDLEQCVELLVNLQLDKGPIIEAITILRNENPVLFSWLKPRLAFRPLLQMSLDIRFDYEEAIKRLSSGNGSGNSNKTVFA